MDPDLNSPKSCGYDRILLWIHNTACEKSKNLFRSIRSLLICVYEGSDEDEDDDGDNEKDDQPIEEDDEQNDEQDEEQNDEDEEQNDEDEEQNDEDEGWSPLDQE